MPARLRLVPTVYVAWQWPRVPALPRAELSRPWAAWAMASPTAPVLRRAPAMAASHSCGRGAAAREAELRPWARWVPGALPQALVQAPLRAARHFPGRMASLA